MLRRPQSLVLCVLSIVLVARANPGHADWPATGVPGSDAPVSAQVAVSAPDASSGIYTVWDESGATVDVYAQRTSAHGDVLWASRGIAVAAFANEQYNSNVAVDAAGNLYVVWQDLRAPVGIRAQKVAPNGALLWDANGVVVVGGAGGSATFAWPVADEAGGCIVTWQDSRSGNYDVYVQNVSGAGTVSWTPNGVNLSAVANTQQRPVIALADAGSVIVAWEDFRSGASYDTYAQKVNSAGAILWALNGSPVATGPSAFVDVKLIHDGAGGGIFAYEAASDVGGQRLDAAGSPLWGAAGLLISGAAANNQFNPRIISDGAGGAIVAWNDNRDGQGDIYAQRMSATGAHLWDYLGQAVCTTLDNQLNPTLAPDGQGGAIVVWTDPRNITTTGDDIYAQRLDADGLILWSVSGDPVLASNGHQNYPVVHPDGNGNAVFHCYDLRSFYARATTQRIDGFHGYWGHPEPDLYSVEDMPGDQGGHVGLNWFRSERDKVGQYLITHYSVWRAVDKLPLAARTAHAGLLIDLSDVTVDMTGPAYRLERTPDADYFWEYVGQQQALYTSGYSYNATTRYDSTAGDPAEHTFQVVAHTDDAFTFWPSQAVSGHSIDNLAPAAPLMLTAQRIGGDDVLLEWSPGDLPGDLADYMIYRAGAGGVTPIPGNFLTSATDTSAVDPTATASSAFWYIVTARDVHDNQSPPSNEAMVDGGPTGIGDTPSPRVLTLLSNAPNPFASSTVWRVGLPSGGEVSLEVYDVAGRRVRSERRSLGAGWQAVTFDGRDGNGRALPSGVYFYRVSAAGETRTAKMVVHR